MLGISIGRIASYAGYRLVGDPHWSFTVEDWSEVRSPARAARRLRRGFPQRIRYCQAPKREVVVMEAQRMIVGHPTVIAEILAAARTRLESTIEAQTLGALLGRGK